MRKSDMRKNDRLFAVACGLLLLTACAVQPLPAPPVDPLTPADHAARQLLAWDETRRVMTEEQRRQEQARLEQGLPAPASTLELALLLAEGNEAERARSLVLLQSLAGEAVPEPWRRLALLLLPAWQKADTEQRSLHERLEQQGQQLKESQKKNEQLNDRIGQLNQKLEALKAIELSIPNRPASPDAPTLPVPRSAP